MLAVLVAVSLISAAILGLLAKTSVIACAVLFLIGEGLLLSRWFGVELTWLLPTAHTLSAATFGVDVEGNVRPFAWFLSLHLTWGQMLVSLAIFVIGLTIWRSGVVGFGGFSLPGWVARRRQ